MAVFSKTPLCNHFIYFFIFFFSLSYLPFSSSLMSAPFSSTHLPCDLLLPLWLVWLNKCCSSQAANTWTKLSPTGTPPSARYGHTAVATAVGIYIFGGRNGGRRLREMRKARPGIGLNHHIAVEHRQRLAPLQRGAGPCRADRRTLVCSSGMCSLSDSCQGRRAAIST